jgi:hypothetical protein
MDVMNEKDAQWVAHLRRRVAEPGARPKDIRRWKRAINGVEKAGSSDAWFEAEDAHAFAKLLAREEREMEDES